MNLKLAKTDAKKWYQNLLVFFAPVAIVYLTQVVGFIQQANGAVNLKDFVPTAFTNGAVALYIINSALDYFKKLTGK